MNIIDYLAFAITLVPVVIIGWLSARRSHRDNTSREFQLAGKGINKIQAGFSMAATDFGGSGLVYCRKHPASDRRLTCTCILPGIP